MFFTLKTALPLCPELLGRKQEETVGFQRITEWLRWKGTSQYHLIRPPAQAGLARAGCPALCPLGFRISPWMEAPQTPSVKGFGLSACVFQIQKQYQIKNMQTLVLW